MRRTPKENINQSFINLIRKAHGLGKKARLTATLSSLSSMEPCSALKPAQEKKKMSAFISSIAVSYTHLPRLCRGLAVYVKAVPRQGRGTAAVYSLV